MYLPPQRRARFTLPFKCTRCGQAGALVWEENADRSGGPPQIPVYISPGFHVGEGKTEAGDPQIVCDGCDAALAH